MCVGGACIRAAGPSVLCLGWVWGGRDAAVGEVRRRPHGGALGPSRREEFGNFPTSLVELQLDGTLASFSRSLSFCWWQTQRGWYVGHCIRRRW